MGSVATRRVATRRPCPRRRRADAHELVLLGELLVVVHHSGDCVFGS